MTQTIRYAKPGDAAALVELASAVGGEPEGWMLSGRAWRSVAEERRYLRALRGNSNGAVLVADAGGTVVGRLSISRDPHPASLHVADFGLMVAADYRNQGIGTALLTAAEGWARRGGVSKLELHVFPHNVRAISLYEKLGYEHEGFRRAHYRRPDGRFVDAILMAKPLNS